MRHRIKRKVVLAVLALLLWVGLIGSSAQALLNDSASLTGNALTVGSVGLLISNSQNASSTIYDKSREGFAVNLVPGQSVERFFLLKNTSDDGVPLSVDVLAQLPNGFNNTLASKTTVTFVPVDENGSDIAGSSHVGGSLSAMTGNRSVLQSVIQPGKYQRYKMLVALAAEYTVPGDSVAYDLLFTGTQAL